MSESEGRWEKALRKEMVWSVGRTVEGQSS